MAWTDEQQILAAWCAVAAGAALATMAYFNWLRVQRLQARYEFVAAQLRDLYGPLFALTRANGRTWKVFRAEFRPGRRLFAEDDPMSPQEARAYASWVAHVFQPSNRRMRDVLVHNAHLHVGGAPPDCVLDFLAHVDLFDALIAQWDAGDYTRLQALVRYPIELDEYVSRSYAQVHALHARLARRRGLR